MAEDGLRLPFDGAPPRRYPSLHNPTAGPDLALAVEDLLHRGVVTRVPRDYVKWCNPFFTVEKSPGSLERRPILDCSVLNSRLVPPPPFSLPSPTGLVGPFTPTSVAAVIDLKHGYHSVRVHPDSKPCLCFAVGGSYYAYERVPMGCAWSARAFCLLTQAAATYVASTLGIICLAYSDDFFCQFASPQQADVLLPRVIDTLHDFGFLVHPDKVKGPAAVDWLGWSVDVRRGHMAIPPKRIRHLRRAVRAFGRQAASRPVHVKSLASIIGKLSFLAPVCLTVHLDLMPLQQILAVHVNTHGWDSFVSVKSTRLDELNALVSRWHRGRL